MSMARIGLLTALANLALDQASKLYLLFVYDLPLHDPLRLGPFLSFTAVWNRGISYGLFQQDSALGRWLLIGLSLVACAMMGVWLMRATSLRLAVSLGSILGGAGGNAIDRAAYGAVFDFVHLHAGSFSWYVFNIADAAIVFGVMGLIYDAFVADRQHARAA